MERGQWEQTLIYSDARFASDGQAIATSFDGTVQLFHLDGPYCGCAAWRGSAHRAPAGGANRPVRGKGIHSGPIRSAR
jgi:hypothetical protein